MLDRILNINPQDKYKSGVKNPSGNYYTVNKFNKEKQNSRDTAMLSPLARLLSKINWRILNIEYPTETEILFNFLVNDTEFITLIDLNEIYNQSLQQFTIYQVRTNYGKKRILEVKLEVEKNEINILSEADPIITQSINEIFDRLNEFDTGNMINTSNPEIMNQTIMGIQSKINEELNYILKVIYTFIYTRNKNKIKKEINLKSQKNNPIIMQKVVINNAE